MNLRSIWIWLVAAVLWHGARADARAQANLWPLYTERVTRTAEGREFRQAQSLGPLLFTQGEADGDMVTGWRPLGLTRRDAEGRVRERHVLYPLYSLRRDERGDRWSMLNLVRGEHPVAPASPRDPASFELWPFYLARDTGDPATSYRALFPVRGELPGRFGQERLTWTLFPLYGRAEKDGRHTTVAPWPFMRVFGGEDQRGGALWPLGGHREVAGAFTERYLLWPLVYHRVDHLSLDGDTRGRAHFLPFYAVDRSPTAVSETWLWPFFGYVHRTEPREYHARHYFWPLLVQGHGAHRRVNRWAPVYSHSRAGGAEKTWVLWPLWREETWPDAGLDHTRRQVLYFLYHDTEQRSAARPDLPAARKVHLWPLVSTWDNGAGRRQAQVLSPFEVFFPHQETVRRLWSPLFALYRFDQAQPGDTRHALLWDAVTYERTASADTHDFRLGPLLGVRREAAGREITLLGGLLGLRRTEGEQVWRLFSTATAGRGSAPSPSSP
jgi:hypothetical protein